MVLLPAATGPSMAIIDGLGIAVMHNYIPEAGIRQLFFTPPSYEQEDDANES